MRATYCATYSLFCRSALDVTRRIYDGYYSQSQETFYIHPLIVIYPHLIHSFRQWECLDALIDFDFIHNHDHDDDLDSRTYLNVKFSALSIYEVKSGGSHLKKSIWPANDFDHWPQGHDRDYHWMSPSKPYNICLKSFFPSALVSEIFTWWF